MLYYSGKPLFEWSCRDRKAIESLWGAGSSPPFKQVVGLSGRRMPWGLSYTCWRLVGLTGIVRWLVAGWLGHQLAFLVTSRNTNALRGCHFFLDGWWLWGSFMGTDCLVGGSASLLVRLGRLRYYLTTTADHSALLGRCCFKIFGREIFLGYIGLTRLGEG